MPIKLFHDQSSAILNEILWDDQLLLLIRVPLASRRYPPSFLSYWESSAGQEISLITPASDWLRQRTGKWDPRPVAQPDICNGACPLEGPLTSEGPTNFYFLLGFRPLHFANTEKRIFFVKICRKNCKMPAWGALTSQGPQFHFSPRISATSFCKYDKTFFL